MSFVEKELAAVLAGLHVRTNGDGDAIGMGILLNQEEWGFWVSLFLLLVVFACNCICIIIDACFT
jgi:hypothetical protein